MARYKFNMWTLPNKEGYFLCKLGKDSIKVTHGPFKTVEDFEAFVRVLKKQKKK